MAWLIVITFFISVVALFLVKRKYKDVRLSYLRSQKHIRLSQAHNLKKTK